MKRRQFIGSVGGFATLSLAACGSKTEGGIVQHIILNKRARQMHLIVNNKKFKTYKVDLGFQPLGHKKLEGDGRTPEGTYFIYTKNPNSAFHLSLGISYPNRADVQYARSIGASPGGEIFIHGEATDPRQRNKRDWTAGCIAVTNREMNEIYKWVGVGTTITINP